VASSLARSSSSWCRSFRQQPDAWKWAGTGAQQQRYELLGPMGEPLWPDAAEARHAPAPDRDAFRTHAGSACPSRPAAAPAPPRAQPAADAGEGGAALLRLQRWLFVLLCRFYPKSNVKPNFVIY